jgi:cyclic pyranopterin phosphate synthase
LALMLRDSLGRPLHDLRISVTDRCNFRCVYCMPREVFGSEFPHVEHAALLTFEEIARLARLFVREGAAKIRLTGGEPLLRRDLERLVAMLAEIEGLHDLTLTTNGSLLTRGKARTLRAAGLRRITISLDSLDEEQFRAISDNGIRLARVLEAIDAAAEAGLRPVKIDMVVRRGMNDDAIEAMAGHFRGSGHIVRFIEFMDVGNSNGWSRDAVVPGAEIVARIAARWPVEPVERDYFGEVAERWRYRDGAGEFGVITSVSQPFCGSCTRARLSSTGTLYTCLFAGSGEDLRAMLRAGEGDEAIRAKIAAVWRAREDRYSEVRAAVAPAKKIEMSYIGG